MPRNLMSRKISFGTIAVFATLFLFASPGVIASGYSQNNNATPALYAGQTGPIHWTRLAPSVSRPTSVNCAVKPFCSYVTDISANDLNIVQGGKVVGTLTLCGAQGGAAYDPKTQEVFVGDYGCGQVDVINATTNTLVTSITGLPFPFGVVYSTKSHMIYVTEFGSGEVTVINPKTLKVVTEIPTCGTYPEFIDQVNKGNVYVASRFNCVDEINPKTNKVVNTVSFGSAFVGIAVNQANKEVYVNDVATNTVYVLNSTTLATITSLTGFSSLWGSFYNSKTQEVYTDNYATGQVTPINASNVVKSPINVGNGAAEPNSGCSVKAFAEVPGYLENTQTLIKADTVKKVLTLSSAVNPFSCGGT